MNSNTNPKKLQQTKAAPKKSIFFAMSFEKTPMEWTQADFARECVQYCDRRDQLESLKADQEAHKIELLTYFRENEIKDFTVVNHTITATAHTKKQYSRKFAREEARLKEQIRSMKDSEEKSGECQIERREYNHITVTTLEVVQ
tara:strand:+ start:1039 stop:1470 length:432 start_codon:yes stop_codon:yes gene_type:complete